MVKEDTVMGKSEEDSQAFGDNMKSSRQTEEISPLPTARLPWPEDRDPDITEGRMCRLLRSLNDIIFYAYMGRILHKGAELHRQRRKRRSKIESNHVAQTQGCEEEMNMDDLFAVPKALRADHLQHEFSRLYRELGVMTKDQEEGKGKNGREGRSRKRILLRRTSPWMPFTKVLWGLAKPTYVKAGIFQLIALLSQVSMPILVREVLLQMEANKNQSFITTGIPLAFALLVVSVLEGVSMERQKYLAFQTGIVLRSAIINAVYDYILRLTPGGRSGLTSGEVTNLVAIDSQKLFELAQEGHQAWSCPLAMIIVTILLLLELGPTILVGMASMFLLIPVVQHVVGKMMHIRKKRVAQTDRRIQATATMLQAMKFTKLNHYEDKFRARVMEARANEMKLLQKELSVLAITFFLTVTSPVIASALTFITYALVDGGNVLTPSTTFTTLFLFAALRFPINYYGKLMGKAAQGIHAIQRFADFFSRETRADFSEQSDAIISNGDSSNASNANSRDMDDIIRLKGCSFTVGNSAPTQYSASDPPAVSKASFTVQNIDMAVKRTEVFCIVGPVASGKSTLIGGLLGEVEASADSNMIMHGSIGYASQTPFILNSTLRDNILFGRPFDKLRYSKVLDACCLLQDLEQIGSRRDMTEIGERGVTLSGGQKARVSLARTVYGQPDVAILDDPLSALDAATGKSVFVKLLKSTDHDLFGNSAVVLVTHAAHFLRHFDQLMILVDGQPAFSGKWNDLSDREQQNHASSDTINSILSAVQEDTSDKSDKEVIVKSEDDEAKDPFASMHHSGGELMTTEEREFGLSDWRTWVQWYHYAGGMLFTLTVIIALVADRFFYVGNEWWLAIWTSGTEEPIQRFGREYPAQIDGKSAQFEYIETYAIILTISFAACFLRAQLLVQGGARASNRLVSLMTTSVLSAPMYYFETTPFGRLLNRFTYDTEILDITLTQNMTMLMTASGWFVAGVGVMSVILPWQILALTAILSIYWFLLLHYRKSAVDLQRLDAVARSPVQAQLAEVLDGTATIRAFGKGTHFSQMFRSSLDESSASMMNFLAAQTWLRVRIQIIGSFSVFFSVCIVVSLNDQLQISPGIAAMLIIWSSNFTICLGFMVQAISESEASMTSVERILSMLDLPQEEDSYRTGHAIPAGDGSDKSSKGLKLQKGWPESGELTFKNVSLRYRPGLPLALDGVSFHLKSGKRCGVVGRTGSGKSTITVALFRLTEIESGRITLDGVDLSKIPLAEVRGRKNGMTIIMQDPVLFAGTLRECLDPFGESTDEEILEALIAVRVGNAANRGLIALDDCVEDGGDNYSLGERQLLCLGRAILAQPRILILDEATASVDGETDAFIQKMLRTRFQGTTLLTIAHRLNTIMDYECILALDEGKVIEFGKPKDLLEINGGLFRSLVDSTGKESAQALRSSVI